MKYAVTTFYKFTALPKNDLPGLKKQLETAAQKANITGLLLIAEEGLNATLAGSKAGILDYKKTLAQLFGTLTYKDSTTPQAPFKRFKVKIKAEIVQLGRTDIQPNPSHPHLSPDQWDNMLSNQEAIVIDVRNWYETKLGTFKNAIDPKTWKFSQFPAWLKKSNLPKDKPVAIFCTGGIRCEKAAVAMQEQGYHNVYQLDGGILNYLAKKPNKNFEGDCFVFDHRIAVGQDLSPSQTFTRCPHCGNGGSIKASCVECQSPYQTCEDCASALPAQLCSKNCRYHYQQSTAQSSPKNQYQS